jgi:7,8-dihydropterin-6-yl-methyl-4-(beta-D-ribofuranosyl)aminobenzene 5'-phosphate synthase
MTGTAGSMIELFGETASVEITVLMDNRADLLVKPSAGVKRFSDGPLLAEHGFAALLTLEPAGPTILWDAGMTSDALLENMKRMKIAPSSISMIALSHGHGDHTAALTNVLKAMDLAPTAKKWAPGTPVREMRAWAEGRRTPLILHPAALRERWRKQKDGGMLGPLPVPPHQEWEAAGAQVIRAETPYRLAPGCWTTGSVPRRSFETAGIPANMLYRDGDAFLPDIVDDDQAIVCNVSGKGLVILAGCAHSGILNTVAYAQEISGIQRIHAVLGGFHLANAQSADVQRTIDTLKALRPSLIAPTHCTGFAAMAAFASQMPDAFVQGVVGTTYQF